MYVQIELRQDVFDIIAEFAAEEEISVAEWIERRAREAVADALAAETQALGLEY